MSDILSCNQLYKAFHDAKTRVDVLQGVDFKLHAGERIAILGPSGSGKSTLMHCLGGLDTPDTGQVFVAREDIATLSEARCGQLRNTHLGFVYQFHHLLPEFSALDNVAMPLYLRKMPIHLAKERAQEMLERVGLKARMQHKPSQLSGGERQRTAIARAIVNHPACLLADEPTGNLDAKTAEQVYALLLELNQSLKMSLLIVTHDLVLAKRMDKVMTLTNGRLYEQVFARED